MFAVGQRVWHRLGQRSGTVLECDGGRVYIEQDNGVELDFLAADLTAEPPAATCAKPQIQTGPGKPVNPAVVRTLTARDITPEHSRVLAVIPARTLQAVAALFEARPGASRFSTLDTAGKLNFIAGVTGVPYKTMQEYSDRPGELGLLMGKGLAHSA